MKKMGSIPYEVYCAAGKNFAKHLGNEPSVRGAEQEVAVRNLLTYVSIAAMLGWSIVSLAAITQLGRSLIALWRERHPNRKAGE